MIRVQQLLQKRLVDWQALRLKIGAFIPVDAQPAHGIENGVDGLPGGAFKVGVFKTQHETPAGVTGVKPVEKGRAGTAHVQETCGAGRESGNDRIHMGYS